MIIALDKVRYAMEEAGSSMNNIIKTLMLLRALGRLPAHAQDGVASTTRSTPPVWWRTPGQHLHGGRSGAPRLPGRDRRGRSRLKGVGRRATHALGYLLASRELLENEAEIQHYLPPVTN